MTLGELVDSTIIAVNGGKLTADSKIRREDVISMLPSAINYTITSQFYLYRKETGENEIPDSYIGTYYRDVLEDEKRGLRYVELPPGITLPKNYGLQSISPLKGNTLFVQISFNERQHNDYYSNSFADVTLYWEERNRGYFQNLPDITTEVIVRRVNSIEDLNMDDQIPLAAGMEFEVMQLMREWFTGQRAAPADNQPNNQDTIDAT